MADYKKNLISGFINPFDSSKSMSAERMFSNIQDSIEANILSRFFRKGFKGVALSGMDSGVWKAESGGLLVNMPELVDIGDGVPRWKTRFTIHESLYGTEAGNVFTQFYGKSPLIVGTNKYDMSELINRCPYAYTDLQNSVYSGMHFGSIINVVLRHGLFFITSIEGAVSVRAGTEGQSLNEIIKSNKNYNLNADVYDVSITSLPNNYWEDILYKVIAEGRADNPDTCITGKTFRDYCPKVDGGNVGIAHFANKSLNNLLARMIRKPPDGYGVEKVEGWFGQKVSFLKQIFPTCYMPYYSKKLGKYVMGAGKQQCSKKFAWYNKGWRSFVNEYNESKERKALMKKIQLDTYRDTKVKKAERIIKEQKYPINMRNMAAVLGILNSYGSWGPFKGLNPEQAMNKYMALKPGNSHREKRVKLIRSHYPIKKGSK